MIVEDPSGGRWRIKRRWLPWRLRKRSPDVLGDMANVGVDDLLVGLAVLLVVLIVLVVVPIVAVLAIMVAEAFLLLLLLPLFVVLRASLVAKWPIEAWHDRRLVHAEAVRGWGASRRRMRAIVDAVRLGQLPGSGASSAA